MNKFTIRVYEHLGAGNAVASDDGDSLFTKIDQALDQKVNVELDFSDITLMTTAFLNAAIGQLYSKYTSDDLKANFTVANMDDDDLELLVEVIERAKEYFSDPEKFSKAVRDSLD
jgi:hypothetical protein